MECDWSSDVCSSDLDYYDAQRQKSTKWVRCTKFFDGTNTPVVAQWLKKGTRVFCQGNMKPGGVFTNKTTGEQYENWDLTIAHLELLGNKGEPGTQQQPSLPAPQSAGNQQMSGRPLTPNEVYQQAISRPVPETDLPF
jgi:single-stranded DNA-binding protein